VLAKVKGQPHEPLVNEVVLRAQSQAEYTHENYGHFGLNLRRYAHFTSPIRRYADLIVHRALIAALKLGPGGMPDIAVGELAEIAARISAAERRAMAAERETVDRLIAAHLADQIGARFAARISGVTRSGLFVRLLETGADGFVPAATLGQDYFAYDEAAHSLTSKRSGQSYRLADVIEVRLVEAAPIAGALRFEIAATAGGGRPARQNARAKPVPRGPKRPRRAR
jgi:ribonuclease R